MTQMQSPYQDQSQADVNLYQEPERTSIMAIMSMIFGIGGCCLGVTSIPAIFLGIFSLVGISKSKGRVGGSGFGITGILFGLITLALWGGLIGAGVFGLNSMVSTFGADTEQVFLDLQANNFDSTRSLMASPAGDATDEELVAFREGYRSGLGDLVSKPDGVGDLISGYIAIGESIQPYNGRPGYIPIPMRFDSGWGLVIYVIDQQSQGQGMPKAIEYIVIDAQGNEYHLPGFVASATIDDGEAQIDEDEPDSDTDTQTEPDDGP